MSITPNITGMPTRNIEFIFILAVCLNSWCVSGFALDKTEPSSDLIALEKVRIIYDPADSLNLEDILSMDMSALQSIKPIFSYDKTAWIIAHLDSEDVRKIRSHYELAIKGIADAIEINHLDVNTGRIINTTTTTPHHLDHSFDLPGISTNHPIVIKTVHPGVMMIGLEFRETSTDIIHQRNALIAALTGVLLFIMIINLYKGVQTHERVYFVYAAYVLFFIFFSLCWINSLPQYFLEISAPTRRFFVIYGVFALSILGAWYGIEFLQLRKHNRYFFYSLLLYIVVLTLVTLFIPYQYRIFVNGISWTVLPLVLFIYSAVLWFQGHKYVAFYSIGYFLYAIFNFSYYWFRSLDLTTPFTTLVPLYNIAVFAEVLFLNISLNHRTQLEKQQAEQEKERSQQDLLEYRNKQNEMLEKEVAERTEKLKKTQDQLIESEKMAAIGVLTAGIAHEINNPINFVYAGVNSLEDNLKEVKKVIDAYSEINTSNSQKKLSEIEQIKDKVAFDKLMVYMDRSAVNIKRGAERTSEIVKGLQAFSRKDDSDFVSADIHDCLNDSLVLLSDQMKDKISISKHYGDIPPIECYPGKMHQVFLNVFSNAIQAIEDKGTIDVRTELSEREGQAYACISIKDSGKGMTRDIQRRIFEPFFTTKEAGQGTGLGLSISHGIIKEHNGFIEVESKPDDGTCIKIFIPLREKLRTDN